MRHFLSIFVAFLFSITELRAGMRAETLGNADASVDPSQSVAVFVGVRDFTYDPTVNAVPYAVDDAVDLAYEIGLHSPTPIVPPTGIVLALSGEPQKAESQQHLDALKAAGAEVRPAGHSDILMLLENQADAVGSNGMFIVAFATHGINDNGTQRLLTSTSLLRHPETMVSEATVREIVSESRAARSLILIDACRSRLMRNDREGTQDPRSKAALLRDLSRVTGQVVFSAAAAGDYAYDDDVRRNGVFTAEVLNALRCGAPVDDRGYVTVETLADYVETHVLAWVQQHRDRNARIATQLQCEGRSKMMPLATCRNQQRNPQ